VSGLIYFGECPTVRLAKVDVTLGLAPMEEESLRLTAAEGTDSNGKEVCAMVVVVEEIQQRERYIYAKISQSNRRLAF
jgi:hypothetical protein